MNGLQIRGARELLMFAEALVVAFGARVAELCWLQGHMLE
jgi:hypothetical protein